MPATASLLGRVLAAGAIQVRDVESGEEPFVYSTGNRGPGYVQIKGLVGRPALLKDLVAALAETVDTAAEFDFINGNATGGMIPAWELRGQLSARRDREIPFTYLRGARKPGGHGEMITGLFENPAIRPGMRALIVEELVNYAGTLTNATGEFRRAGFEVTHGACLVAYDQPEARDRVAAAGVTLHHVFTLPELLAAGEAEGVLSPRAVGSYREFLADPLGWQLARGYAVPDTACAAAQARGIELNRLGADEALEAGAPPAQVHAGVVFYAGPGA